MSNNVKVNISDRFAVVKTFFDYGNRADWDGIMTCLSDNFVWEIIPVDGPNLRFTREAFRKHHEGFPDFKRGEVSNDTNFISE
jgi:ketosteroid isomerase-like protein